MKWKAKLTASILTAFAIFVLTSLQGCLSAVSKPPANSIVDESGANSQTGEKEVRHQPTILRAEAAASPVSDRPADLPVGLAAPDALVDQSASSEAGIHSVHAQIADLLPIPSLDTPPPNQR
jgi:hypothetical protein